MSTTIAADLVAGSSPALQINSANAAILLRLDQLRWLRGSACRRRQLRPPRPDARVAQATDRVSLTRNE